ncbi:uromodulin-like [Pleurodeles waltl]|uniref:uromodulin-like n=1 Tax=Pleurodeles waltl TaxID=8319 RepID=UPI003709ACFC
MKAWLGLALVLCVSYTASGQAPPCGVDELLNVTSNTCYCDFTKYPNLVIRPEQPSLQCLSGEMKLSMGKCQLERSKFDTANIHLLNPSCVAARVVNGTAQMVVSTSTSSQVCGNILSLSADSSSVIYSNNLTIPGKVSPAGIVSRQSYVYNFSCSYPLKNIPVYLATAIKPVVGIVAVAMPDGTGSIPVLMYAYVDASFSIPYTESTTPLQVQDPIYLRVTALDLNGDAFSVRVNRLFASQYDSAASIPQYNLITDGCRDSQNSDFVTINRNGETNEARITVTVFEITDSDSLFFHANVEICEGRCVLACTGNGARSGAIAADTPTVTMGPIYAETPISAGSCERNSWIWMVIFLMLSLLVQRLHK